MKNNNSLGILIKEVKTLLLPEGFKCRGRHFRRYQKPFMHCMRIQKRSDGGAICINLGVHLDFIPTAGTLEMPDSSKIKEIDCEIRTRLSTEGLFDQWWELPLDVNAREEILSLLSNEGLPFFGQFECLPGILGKISTDDIESKDIFKIYPDGPNARLALLLARVHLHLGNHAKVREFASYGLSVIGERATSLKIYLQRILRDVPV